MQHDEYKSDKYVLIGTSEGLKTTNGEKTEVLVPLLQVRSFTQINRTQVVFIDYRNHCIKVLNRQNNSVKFCAGVCGSYEEKMHEDGFFHPFALEKDIRNPGQVLVTDFKTQSIRTVNLNTGKVEVLIRYDFRNPLSLQWFNQTLLVASYYDLITQVSWNSNGTVSAHVLTGTRNVFGDRLGTFDEANSSTIYDIEKYQNEIYLMADSKNRKLKLVDMNAKRIGPVCFNKYFACTRSTKFPSEPRSLLKLDGELLIGMEQNIYKTAGRL